MPALDAPACDLTPEKSNVSPMETFIIVVALLAAAIGSLVLLGCLAGKRAQLFEAFRLQQQLEEQQRTIRQRAAANRRSGAIPDNQTAEPPAGQTIPTAQ